MTSNDLIKQAMALLQQALNEQSPTPGPIEPPVRSITSVSFQSLSDKPQETVPFTFGQVFAMGDIKPDSGLAGRFDNGDTIPLQVNVKALHSDGSVRHAIISGIHAPLFGKEVRKMELIPAALVAGKPTATGQLSAGKVQIIVDGQKYATSGNSILKHSMWLEGPIANEIHATMALVNEKNVQHPHIHVRAKMREYANGAIRLDLSIENDWAYEKDPQNFTYDLLVEVGGKKLIDEKAFKHFHHARRREVFWLGQEPQVNIMQDSAYIISTKAVANYSLDAKPSEQTLQALADEWKGDKIKPMGIGLAYADMAGTGGRRDIGLLPGWAVMWLLSQDQRAAMVTNGTANSAGSWPTHYRDKETDQPLSVIDYPFGTTPGKSTSDSYNRDMSRHENFPGLVESKSQGAPRPESSHQPQFAYLSYILTGDHHFLEEMQFWAMWNILSINPSNLYRQNIKGLVWNHQVRAQAWSLRSLLDCAYMTPDSDRLKEHFSRLLDTNLDWYNATYTDNPKSNQLGVLTEGALRYKDGTAIAPWQDDFFTSVIGRAAEMGFDKAKKLMSWKSRFVVDRMAGDGADWRVAANYNYTIVDAPSKNFFNTIAEACKATVAAAMNNPVADDASLVYVLKNSLQDFPGDQKKSISYVANMQPSLALASVWMGEKGKKAWSKFTERPVKPDYTAGPQFAIVPR